MRNFFVFICIMISLTAYTAVQVYAEKETGEYEYYLHKRENKELPDMTHPEIDGIVVFRLRTEKICKNVDEMLNKYIIDYYYYDDRTNMIYHEAGKKKPFVFLNAPDHNIDERVNFVVYDNEESYKAIKELLDDDAIRRVDSDITIYNKYYFNFSGYPYAIWNVACYETNLGNYVYVWEQQRVFGSDRRKYLMSFDSFLEYVEELRIYNEKLFNGSIGGGDTRNPFDLSIFDSNSPDFNPDARIEDVLYPGRRIARIIIITCMAAVAITVGVVVIKRKKKTSQ